MQIIDISKELTTTKPYPGDPIPVRKQLASIAQNGYNLSAMRISAHAATHVDAPLHYIPNGEDISALDVSVFLGACSVITVPNRELDSMFFMNLKINPRVLLRGPGLLTKSAIGFLYNSGVRLVGTDRESIGSIEDEATPHHALLGYGIAVLENLDLSHAPDGEYFLSAAPLLIAGFEASPCRAVLIKDIC